MPEEDGTPGNSGGTEEPSHKTAQEWARSTGFGYRAILAAARRGDLVSYRLSESGPYLISAEAFEEWKKSLQVKPKIEAELWEPKKDAVRSQTSDVSEFALKHASVNPPFFRRK